ncbi:MAG TPA: FCD domain-containing protein, partial [Anaerolineae bacterium]
FIFEIFALLETMEVVTGRTACGCMSDEEIESLADLVQRMDASIDDPDHWSEQNKQFHLLICEYAYTGLIKGMMRKVLDHWDRLRLHYLKDVLGQRIVKAQAEHHEIMAAFRMRDPDAVEKILRSHNQNALASYIGYLQSAGYLVVAPGDC